LPAYLGIFLGEDARQLVRWEPFAAAFVWLIAVPLALAAACQAWARRGGLGARVVDGLGLLPVPATAAVLAVVVAAVTPGLGLALDAVRGVAPVYLAFAVLAPLLGWTLARRLPARQRLAVAFSVSTRNSLVVLPLGLAVAGALPLVPAVIVTQTLIELVAELIYVRLAARQVPA
ncbi:arsenic resistance protein, partial [Bordetella hinzii]|nr:arsenic resistance protein [Bordetella hinzii]